MTIKLTAWLFFFIIGRDGEDIVIYDDTEDSESDYEYEEEEEGSERDEVEIREVEERLSSPEPEKKQHTSLRSYLSTSNLLHVPQEQIYFNSKVLLYAPP